jgi:hypothetical protein
VLPRRDVWRGVALAVNAGLYNEVATEALFSAQVGRGPAEGRGSAGLLPGRVERRR